jgi:hypothetical protein
VVAVRSHTAIFIPPYARLPRWFMLGSGPPELPFIVGGLALSLALSKIAIVLGPTHAGSGASVDFLAISNLLRLLVGHVGDGV